jgi:hypothetical protein
MPGAKNVYPLVFCSRFCYSWAHTSQSAASGGEKGMAVSRKLNGAGIEEGSAAARRVKLFSNLALAALLSVILLTLSFWLGGFHLSFLPATADQPSLSISSGPYRVGSIVKLQGIHFSRYAIIALLRDGQPATDSNGMRLAVNSDGQGAFKTTLTITPDWSPGDHIIAAQDTTSGQRASIDISVDNTTGQRGD